MFELTWFWVYYLLLIHCKMIYHSLYVHRYIGHSMLTLSPGTVHFFRFLGWMFNMSGPNSAEVYYLRHTAHHRYAETEKDPHSPYQLSLLEMLQAKWNHHEGLENVSPKTPNDWMQKNVYNPYQPYGKFVGFLIPGILFGPWGFLLTWAINKWIDTYLYIFVGNYLFHKFGFTYEKNRNKIVKAKNLFPLAIWLCGEELHANHHNHPKNINFKKYWFEIDMGYVYAKILRYFGLADFKESKL